MLSDGKITEIFCLAEDFCKFFNNTVKKHSLESKLFINDIQLITKIKSNMKNCLMSGKNGALPPSHDGQIRSA